jgi:crotonobetainyl-CoA:carnitine CoA-transferase CaiB-like acyl-CoA transferase
MVIQSISGMAHASRGADGTPQFANAPSVDFASGMILAQGIMAALLERERSGRGQKVSVSLLDTAIAIQSLEAASQLIYGYETRWFNRALNFVLRTRTGWITVLGFFRNNPLALLCKAFNLPDASLQPHLRTISDQVSHRDEIYRMFEPLVAARTTEEALELLTKEDVLCAPILELAEALEHPQVKHNGMIVHVDVAGQGRVPVIGNPLKLSRTPAEVRRGPPQLDADAEEVRTRFLCA